MKPRPPITATYLQNAATFYLERYPTTAEGLRHVLQRRVARARMADAPDIREQEWSQWMRAAQDGDQAAYARLLKAILPHVRSLVRRRAYGGAGDAEVVFW